MNFIDLTPRQLRKAANVQEKIQSLQHELNQILGHEVPTPLTGTARKSKRRMSAAGRRAIAAGARARWARIKGRKPKRKMSENISTGKRAVEEGTGGWQGELVGTGSSKRQLPASREASNSKHQRSGER